MYRMVMRTSPVLFPAFLPVDEAHQYVRHIMFGNYVLASSYLNPYAEMVKGYKDYSRSLMMAQFELEQDLLFVTDGLKLKVLINTHLSSFYHDNRNFNTFY